jgi:hypothetical protein
MTRCSGPRCATPISALSHRAGPTRCGPSTRMSESTRSGNISDMPLPGRRAAHRPSAGEPIACRPPARRRRRPRCAGPRKVERSRAGLDRTCGRRYRISAAGAPPEESSIGLTLDSLRWRSWAAPLADFGGRVRERRSFVPSRWSAEERRDLGAAVARTDRQERCTGFRNRADSTIRAKRLDEVPAVQRIRAKVAWRRSAAPPPYRD